MSKSAVIIFVGNIEDVDFVDIKCPNCYFSKSFHLEKLAAFKRSINISCKCGNSFTVVLEYRTKQRKKTKLAGLYCDLQLADREKWRAFLDDRTRTNCNVVDLSVAGLAIVPTVPNSVGIGHRLIVRFELDRGVSPVIEFDVIVRNIKGKILGCEFCDKVKYNKKIGFYLL